MTTERQRRSAAENLRKTSSKYVRWTDDLGVSHPLSSHPNYDLCRYVQKHELALHPGFVTPFHEDWLTNIEAFVLGVEADIKMRPALVHRLALFDIDRGWVPGNLAWVARPWPTTRAGRRARALTYWETVGPDDVPVRGADTYRAFPKGRASVERLNSWFPDCLCDWAMQLECPCVHASVARHGEPQALSDLVSDGGLRLEVEG